VPEVTIQPGELSIFNDQGSIGTSESTELFEIQANDVNLNIAPISLNFIEDAEVVVHNITPKISRISLGSDISTNSDLEGAEMGNNVTPPHVPLDHNQSQPNHLCVEDVAPTTKDEGKELSLAKNISPSLLSIDIVPAPPKNDDGIFDKVSLSKVLPNAENDKTEEVDRKVAEDETTSHKAVEEKMMQLLGQELGPNVDENMIKDKIKQLLRTLGNPTDDNPISDDEDSESSTMEDYEDDILGELAGQSESSDLDDLNHAGTTRIRTSITEAESLGDMFSPHSQFDLEKMRVEKFEKNNYRTLKRHSHKLSQNFVNLPSFSSVIRQNNRRRTIFSGEQSLGKWNPKKRRILSEPAFNMYMEEKNPETDVTDEDDQLTHDIDNKAKRLDEIDDQMKALEQELTELTDKSFQLLLEMGEASDEDSKALEKEYLKIEMKSQELRQKKNAMDVERQELVDSVQRIMMSSFDMMSPKDNTIGVLSGFDTGMTGLSMTGDADMFTSRPI